MTAIERLLFLADYWDSNRQAGHTSAMMLGARNVPDVVVVVAMQAARQAVLGVGCDRSAGPPAIRTETPATLNRLSGQHAPLVVDHYAMSRMIREAVDEMRQHMERSTA